MAWSKEHVQEMLLVCGQIGAAITADEFHLTHDIGLIVIQHKAAVIILEIMAGQYNPIGYLKKIFIVAANRAGELGGLGGSRWALMTF